jgi:hypothetical protein
MSLYDVSYRERTAFSDRKKSGYDEHEVLDKLPLILRTQMMDFMYKTPIKNIALFNGLDETTLDSVCLRLKPFECMKDDYIYRAGEVSREVYVIMRGNVAICRPHDPESLTAMQLGRRRESANPETGDADRHKYILEQGAYSCCIVRA